jgi:hypothetical protein
MKAPESVETVLHYANAKPTEKTWRRITLGPSVSRFVAPGAEPPEVPTFGLRSVEELLELQSELRDFLTRWVELESPYSEDADELISEINERARLQFKGWALSPVTEHLIEVWDTETTSFRELLYSYLATALKEVSFRAIHKCEACGDFFYEPSKREWKFCSARCRNRVMVRRHRERQAGVGKKRKGASARRPAAKRK